MDTVRTRGATTTPSPSSDALGSSDRLLYLDNLKVTLTIGVIVAHAAMTYGAAGTWVYEEPSLSDPAEVVLGTAIGAGALFGLGLFFLMAGMLTAAPLRRRGPRRFLVSRVWRLGLPVVAYAIVVWPVLRWLVVRAEGKRISFGSFYRLDVGGANWTSAGTGPMWFVAILLVVTVLWTLWRWARPARARPQPDALRLWHLVATSAAIAAGTFVVRLRFALDSPQFLDLHLWLWPQAACLFALGAVGAERRWLTGLTPALGRACHVGIGTAVAAMGLMVAASSGPDPFTGGWHWQAAGFAVCEGVFSVSMSLVVLEWFRRNLDSQGPSGERLARAAYGAFVAQGPVLVVVALALRDVDLPAEVKFVALAVASVAGAFALATALAVVVRRVVPRATRRGAPTRRTGVTSANPDGSTTGRTTRVTR